MTINYKEIGGFKELEIQNKKEYFTDALRFNNARNALRYVIRAFDIKEIHIPFYTCSTVWQAIQKENCKIKFYRIDENLFPRVSFNENDFILYSNYYGVNGKNVDEMCHKYKNIIADNAHSFYMKKQGIACFNSARKFFGVPDGAYLYSNKTIKDEIPTDNTSHLRFSHLIKRIDLSSDEAYSDFLENEKKLSLEPVKYMSKLTQKLLSGIDYEKDKNIRLENFNYLHSHFKSINELNIDISKNDVPMVYPFLVNKSDLRKKLIENKIYVARYWDVKGLNTFETYLCNNMVPLPVDSRYSIIQMDKIIKTIKDLL